MSSLAERCAAVWERIRWSPRQMPARLSIPSDHVDRGAALGGAFQRNAHYFEVRINEMYLPHSREWFTKYSPMVLAVSEFSYSGEPTTVPFVVGPSLVEKFGQKMPDGMIFADTRVAGPYPYRGGAISLLVVLYRLELENYGRKLLSFVESAAKALDFSTALGPYLKVADVVMDGVEELLGVAEKTQPLVGLRKEYFPAQPGYFALIDAPESELNAGLLWIQNNQLFCGSTLATATPYREASYVLYSLEQTEDRGDVTTLPFHKTWQHVVQEADKSSKKDVWESAKANMATLLGLLDTSPDLTTAHATLLGDEYITTMQRLHERAVRLSTLGKEAAEPSDLDRIRPKALTVLEM